MVTDKSGRDVRYGHDGSLWVWTHYTADAWAVGVSGGRVRVTFAGGISGSGWGVTLTPRSIMPGLQGYPWLVYKAEPDSEVSWRVVSVPLSLPLVVAAIPTAILFYRDRRRIPPGHCRKCGYNLTGNVSGRCPECGTAT